MDAEFTAYLMTACRGPGGPDTHRTKGPLPRPSGLRSGRSGGASRWTISRPITLSNCQGKARATGSRFTLAYHEMEV